MPQQYFFLDPFEFQFINFVVGNNLQFFSFLRMIFTSGTCIMRYRWINIATFGHKSIIVSFIVHFDLFTFAIDVSIDTLNGYTFIFFAAMNDNTPFFTWSSIRIFIALNQRRKNTKLSISRCFCMTQMRLLTQNGTIHLLLSQIPIEEFPLVA